MSLIKQIKGTTMWPGYLCQSSLSKAACITGRQVKPGNDVNGTFIFDARSFQKSEMRLRRIGNWWVEIIHHDLIEQIHSEISNIDPNSSEYIIKFIQLARLFSSFQEIEVEVNLQSGNLEDIVNSPEACLFIINHDHQAQDPVLLSMFGVLLYEEYLKAQKGETCPRPKVLLNQDILSSKSETHRKIYEMLGAVSVDAAISKSFEGERKNARSMMSLLRSFCKDENHLFVFPEGRLSALKRLELREKFQVGVGQMVSAALVKKKQVKVVPLGFAFTPNKREKQPLGSIYIGEPVYFVKTKGGIISTNIGNVAEKYASDAYKKFFYEGITPYVKIDDINLKVITENGVPVTVAKEQPAFIADILAENLRISRELAIEQLPKSSLGDEVAFI